MEQVRKLLDELAAIENSIHNYADPAAARDAKMREVLQAMADAIEERDRPAIDGLEKFGDYDQKLDALIERIESLEPKPAEPPPPIVGNVAAGPSVEGPHDQSDQA